MSVCEWNALQDSRRRRTPLGKRPDNIIIIKCIWRRPSQDQNLKRWSQSAIRQTMTEQFSNISLFVIGLLATQAGSHLYHHWDLVEMRASWLAGCLTQSVTGMGWRSGMDKQTKCVIIVPLCRSAELRWSMDRLLHYHLLWLIDLRLVAPRSNRKPIHFEIVSIESSSLSHHSP